MFKKNWMEGKEVKDERNQEEKQDSLNFSLHRILPSSSSLFEEEEASTFTDLNSDFVFITSIHSNQPTLSFH